MNTKITYRAFGGKAQEAINCGKTEIIRLEKMLSRFIPDSEISCINKFSGIKSVKITAEVYDLLSKAIWFSKACDGLFDITVGPLVDLWDYKYANEVPAVERIRPILSLVNYCNLVLDPYEKTAELRSAGQSIDLGAIGKGFASDQFIEILKKYNIPSAFTNIGGNVSTLGNKPDGSPWRVGIRHPREENRLIGAVEVTGKAVVTSGDYERYYIDREGNRRHHILNPTTGYPAESGLISVTVVAESAMTADALSTIVFVAGIERGLDVLSNFSETDAILVDQYQKVYITRGLRGNFRTAVGINAIIL